MEYTEKRWRCDYCGRSVRKPEACSPPGWKEAAMSYGNVVHSCPDTECRRFLADFLESNKAIT